MHPCNPCNPWFTGLEKPITGINCDGKARRGCANHSGTVLNTVSIHSSPTLFSAAAGRVS